MIFELYLLSGRKHYGKIKNNMFAVNIVLKYHIDFFSFLCSFSFIFISLLILYEFVFQAALLLTLVPVLCK